MFEGNISLSIFGQFSTCPKQLQMVSIKIEQNLCLLFVILEILNAKDRPTVHCGSSSLPLEDLLNFCTALILYILFKYLYIFVLHFLYFVSFHHWSELIFASWSSFWSSSQLLHSTDGIALSTQWHVSITFNLCFLYWNICFLIMLWRIAYFFKIQNLKPQNVWVEKWQT